MRPRENDGTSTEVETDCKWGELAHSREPTGEYAGRLIHSRLIAVLDALRHASLQSDSDTEHVHELRTASRRASEALKLFHTLLPKEATDSLRNQLQRIRSAADEARNWDVIAVTYFSGTMVSGINVPSSIIKGIQNLRSEAQRPINAIDQELEALDYRERIEQLAKRIARSRKRQAQQEFRNRTSQLLTPVAKKFFDAAFATVNSNESLHSLRLHAKKLRYAMEITASGFDSKFRKVLYSQVALCQNLLGTINDHATAQQLIKESLLNRVDAEAIPFLEGWLSADTRAIADLKTAFLSNWPPKVFTHLNKQFQSYCNLEEQLNRS